MHSRPNGGLSADAERAECLFGLLRVLWRRLAEPSALLHSDLVPGETRLSDLLAAESPRSSVELCKSIAAEWVRIARDSDADSWTFAQLCAAMLPGLPLRETRYFAMRAVRRRHGLLRTAETARRVHAFAADVARRRHSPFWPLRPETAVVPVPQRAPAPLAESLVSLGSEALLDACLVLDLFQFHPGAGVRPRPECEDPDYLLGHIFGMPSRIPGFDALLGGGGLVLADAEVGAREGIDDSAIGGRVVLCAGPFGSGKSLLALQLAVDVARKGGIAWFMAMEQSAEECLYALESLGISTEEPGVFRVVHGNVSDSYIALTAPSDGLGALVFLRPGPEPGDYAKFLENAGTRLGWMSEYPLRLLVVDPVNAFIQPDASAVEMRSRTRQLFERAKFERVNVIFTSEQSSSDQAGAHGFEENIADSVIRLGIEHAHSQTQRYIEVTKSRMQRQFPGRHAVTIQSPGGFHVYPSSAFFARAAPSRALLPPRMSTGFGVAALDRRLGPEALTSGDIAVISGAAEAMVLAAHFLLAASAADPPQRAVFVTDLSADRARAFLSPFYRNNQSLSAVEICAVPSGYVDPGMVLLRIQQALEQRHSAGPLRLMMGNLARWPDAIPLVAGDPAFGVALLEVIRNHSGTAVLVAGAPSTSSAPLVETLANGADTVLQLTSAEFQGKFTTFLRAAKTRLMQHPRDSFALTVGPDDVRLSPSRLLRVDPGGQVRPVPISLFLHAETPRHQIRNQRMLDALRAAISPVSEIHAQDRHFDAGFLSLARRSAVDEVQVLQVDEFQIPGAPSCLTPADALFSVTLPPGGGPLQDRLPKLVDLVTQRDGLSFVAVPFYLNISLLAIDLPRFSEIAGSAVPPQTWQELVRLADSWEVGNPPDDELFFSCPIHESSPETYNCFFFEILHSLRPPGASERQDIAQWFASPQAVQAGILFYRLCRREHALRPHSPARRAVVSRQWFNTLHQQLSEFSPASRSDFAVGPLFGDITTAGEWYLSVPAYSAAPEIGMQLIEAMTTADREIEGVESGVGLPTRAAYYTCDAQASVSRHFALSRGEVHRLWSKGIRRSEFVMYHRSAAPISSHLVSILELPGADLPREVSEVLENLVASLRFLRSSV